MAEMEPIEIINNNTEITEDKPIEIIDRRTLRKGIKKIKHQKMLHRLKKLINEKFEEPYGEPPH